MFSNLRADLQRYIHDPTDRLNIYLFFEQGIWAIVIYRFSRWLRACKIPIFSFFLKLLAFTLSKFIEILTGISIPVSADIGPGFYIGHFGGIILHSNTVIGSNCSIGTGVMIGTRGMGKKGVPIIGDNVYIGVGAKILGSIIIGDNVRIGANSVVISDIPDNKVVVGVPARVVKTL